MNRNEKIETITNRIFINFGIAIAAYIFLWVLISRLNMFYIPVFIFAGIFLAAGAACFILNKKTSVRLKNYAFMFIVFAVLLLITQSSFIVSNIMGIHKFSELLKNSHFLQMIFNTANEVKFIAIAGAVYLIVMLIYNCIMISRLSGNRKNKHK